MRTNDVIVFLFDAFESGNDSFVIDEMTRNEGLDARVEERREGRGAGGFEGVHDGVD